MTKYFLILGYCFVAILLYSFKVLPTFGLDPTTHKSAANADTETCERIDGITLVAPPRAFPGDPMNDINKVGAGWISTVPYGMFRIGETQINFNHHRQWWGEKEEGIRTTVELAHAQGIKVMLKPQLWSHSGWIGYQRFETDEEWIAWEKSYTEFIHYFAKIAAEDGIEMLCFGTELKAHVQARPQYFKGLITSIRTIYSGKLIYSSNWDSYDDITFWDQLDYIGLSAYFPLSEDKTPDINALKKEWTPIVSKLEQFSEQYKKQVVFTEYGYLSVDGSAGKTWLLEKKVRSLDINEQAQANSYEALLSVFEEATFWGGGFLWKWFPFGQGGEGYNERDYTPQAKMAEKVLSKYYLKW